jgi:6-phosphogluconolactonase
LGVFVFVESRHDSIAVYAIDPAKSTLKLVEHVSTEGKTPRNFTFDLSGNWLIAGNEMLDTVSAASPLHRRFPGVRP